MAIVKEEFYIGERLFNRIYSDSNRYVVRDGVSYGEACDPAEFGREYTEGDYMTDDEIESNAEEIVNILTGED